MNITANRVEQRHAEIGDQETRNSTGEARSVLIFDPVVESRQALRGKLKQGLSRCKYYVANSLTEAFSVLDVAEIDCVLVANLDRSHNSIAMLKSFINSTTMLALPVVAISERADQRFSKSEVEKFGILHLELGTCTSDSLCNAVSQVITQERLMRIIAIQNRQIENYSAQRNRYVQRTDELAHELLTPLTAIQEFVSLVFDEVAGPISEEQGKYLAYARGGCDAIRTTVEHLIVTRELEKFTGQDG